MFKKLFWLMFVSVLSVLLLLVFVDVNSSKILVLIDNFIVFKCVDFWLVCDDKSGCYMFIGSLLKFDEIELC